MVECELCVVCVCVSSASLPPCQPRSGTQRALRGQSPAASHHQQQPPWTFGAAGNQLTPHTWQPATHNTVTAAAAAAAANLLWRTPHLDQTAAVSLPLTLRVLSLAVS